MRRALPLAILLILTFTLHADNWPQWRGPKGDGVSTETGLPAQWTETKNILWKVSLPGMGGATPVVWGDRLFLTSEFRETQGDTSKDSLILVCLGTDGKERWRKTLANERGRRARGDEGNPAAASPCTDGKHVWAFVGTGHIACFDLDGNEVWKFNAQERYGRFNIQFGITSTPVLHNGKLFWQLIHSNGAHVICIDAATGKDVWKVERPSDGTDENEHSYASAQLWKKGDDAYLVVHGNDYTTAHALADGKELWRLGELNPRSNYNRFLRFVASPVATEDLIVVPTAKNGPVVGVKPDAKGKIGPGSPYEQWRLNRGTPDVPCPLVHDGLVYLCRENGILSCVDAKTGQEYYTQRLREGRGIRYRASPVYADGKVYCTGRDGVFHVVQAGKQFKVLAENKLPDDFAASPVITGGRIYLRGYKHLYCIGQ
jgi:outer membrane protein assembly factor BamB